MTNPAERNDIDLSRLFVWGNKFELKDRMEEKIADVYVRLVGDADLNRARVFALRKSKEMRAKLKDPNSEERQAYLPDITDENKETLVIIMASAKLKEITGDAIDKIKVPFPKELKSKATLEEQEKHQEEVDKYPQKREKAIKEYIEKEIAKVQVELRQRTLEDLVKEYEASLINNICENEMFIAFKDACVFYGTFKDENHKERLFENIEQYQSSLPEIKAQLLTFYNGLDIGMDELKN